MEEEKMKKNIFLLGMMMSTPLVYAGGVGESKPSGSNSLSAKHDSTVTLQEVSVRANFANEQVTPLNLTTITPQSLRIHTTAGRVCHFHFGQLWRRVAQYPWL